MNFSYSVYSMVGVSMKRMNVHVKCIYVISNDKRE